MRYAVYASLVFSLILSGTATACSMLSTSTDYNHRKAVQGYLNHVLNRPYSIILGQVEDVFPLGWREDGTPAASHGKLVVFRVAKGWGVTEAEQVQLEFVSSCPPRIEPIEKQANYLVFAENNRIRRLYELDQAELYFESLGAPSFVFVRGKIEFAP